MNLCWAQYLATMHSIKGKKSTSAQHYQVRWASTFALWNDKTNMNATPLILEAVLPLQNVNRGVSAKSQWREGNNLFQPLLNPAFDSKTALSVSSIKSVCGIMLIGMESLKHFVTQTQLRVIIILNFVQHLQHAKHCTYIILLSY